MSPERSVAATPENIAAALALLGRQRGGGGTELLGGLTAAYGVGGADPNRSRAVVVVTDGYVTAEAEVFRLVRERLDQANLFAFGIGSGVNRSLMEGMARAGSGEPFIVTKPEEASAAAERFRAYIDRPLLSHVTVSFDGFDAYDQAPARIPDLMAERPLVLFGKYRGQPAGHIVISGTGARGPFRQRVAVTAGTAPREASALRWLWARKQAEWLEDDLTLSESDEAKEAIAKLGLRYGLLTSQTSFVAVDRVLANPGGRQARARQPLPLPAGVSNLAVASTVELSRTDMPPGDPLLTVNAGRDARSVTAYFPFGLIKDLKFDPFRERWQTRFLVPKGVADGLYSVPVVIVHRDGRSETITAQYRIDSAEPDFDVDVQPAPGGVTVRVVATEALRKVTVALVDDPGVRTELQPEGGGADAAADGGAVAYTGFLPLPAGAHQLRVVVADQARNEADDIVICEVP